MPGILPMKVIKVGTSAQSRIAQACDRCRSKKIRCDGITPCCSQCSNVGFECKTSDKLSRRAFPRGYTESLEDRVRALEGEVRELKDLLDEKDEKIDMLSRMHSNSPTPRRLSDSISPESSAEAKPATAQPKEDMFRVQQSPFLLDGEKSDSYFMGVSSGRAFIDAFKNRLQESGKSCSSFNTQAFFTPTPATALIPRSTVTSKGPPRLVSDQMVNIFFQEWAPLFPILHRPTFLTLYADYVANAADFKDRQSLAQLHLVFGIAALSAEWNKQDVAAFENQWQAALDAVISENTLATLQCLVLAQVYCISKADYNKLLHYKGIAVSLSHRLGLHQSQKRFSLGALTSETRRKVFWTLYTLDCFSAALLGLPMLMKDHDIHTEDPSDVDDENVTERGFQPILPGESTRLSSALALFRASRIMSRVLGEIYPAALSHELSLHRISALNDELDAWQCSLAPHLRLQFAQDKPSTSVTSSRSPLLSLTYYYIRTLIHRPAVGSGLGTNASSSVVALADSSKHIIQIVQLLEERRMSFSLCLNKNELLLLSGIGLLFQGLDLKQEGKLIRDNQRLVCSVIEILERNVAPGAIEFKKVACSMLAVGPFARGTAADSSSVSRRNSDDTTPARQATSKSTKKQLQAIASRFSFGISKPVKEDCISTRRSTAPALATGNIALYTRNNSQLSISSARSEPVPTPKRLNSDVDTTPKPSRSNPPLDPPNLDYLPFTDDLPTTPTIPFNRKAPPTPSDWEHLLGYIDTTQASSSSSYDNLFPSPDLLASYIDTTNSPSTTSQDWAPNLDLWTLQEPVAAHSVFSFSEESLTSGGEDLSSCDFGTGTGSGAGGGVSATGDYRGIMMPTTDAFGDLEGLDENFGL